MPVRPETNGRNGRFGLYSLLGRERPRGDFSVTLSQPLVDTAACTCRRCGGPTGVRRGSTTDQLGYSTQVGRVGVNLDVSRTENRRSTEHQVMLNLSIPLYGATSSGVVTGSLKRVPARRRYSKASTTAACRASATRYTYGLGVQRARTSAQYALNGSWSGTYGEVSGQLTHGRSYSQYQINGSGGWWRTRAA